MNLIGVSIYLSRFSLFACFDTNDNRVESVGTLGSASGTLKSETGGSYFGMSQHLYLCVGKNILTKLTCLYLIVLTGGCVDSPMLIVRYWRGLLLQRG